MSHYVLCESCKQGAQWRHLHSAAPLAAVAFSGGRHVLSTSLLYRRARSPPMAKRAAVTDNMPRTNRNKVHFGHSAHM
uniref:Uncharacterized protein n=1 Tax=Heliothis virescens TaxID=7102 RepID=A0A2A4JQ06_HELVI